MDFQAAFGVGGKGWAGAWYAARCVFWRMIGGGLGLAEIFAKSTTDGAAMARQHLGKPVMFCFIRHLVASRRRSIFRFSGCLLFADVLRGNVVGEPDLVVA